MIINTVNNNFFIQLNYGFIIVFVTCFVVKNAHNQQVIYQEIYHGGVTGGGYVPHWQSETPGNIDIQIEPGSQLLKAFLLVGVYGQPFPATMQLNGIDISLNCDSLILTEEFSLALPAPANTLMMRTATLDITNLLSPISQSINIQPPINQGDLITVGRFVEYYIFVAYENISLQKLSTVVYLNDNDCAGNMSYNIESNIIDKQFNASFAIHSNHICDTVSDGTNVYIDMMQIGLIGGQDSNTFSPCGVTNAFQYQNGTLIGIGDDTADTTMNGSDALANIENYIIGNQSFLVDFIYQTLLNPIPPYSPKTNPIIAMSFVHSTPCDTFSVFVNDTLTCYGESVQLNVTGGQSYEWSPGYALSCTTCPNPIATPDSTVTYFLKVTNTPGCSKILPVRVYVNSPVQSGLLQLEPSDCETNTGLIKLTPATGGTAPYFYTVNGITQQANALFENLGNGTYPVLVTDGVGCTWRDTIDVPATVAAQAGFTANPAEGLTPLEVNFVNQSSGAQHYTWYAQSDTAITTNYTHTFQHEGNYNVMLVVYNTDSTCTDTARTVIMAKTAIFLEMPSLYHPNNDGTYTLNTRGITNLKQQWFDASGRLVYNLTTALQPGETLNNGTLQTLAAGTYLYRITATGIHNETEVFEGKVVIVR